jgi:tetratricopeptide (TPR) repeat protein
MVEKKKTGRNDPCSCGSGRKYKACCGSGVGQSAASATPAPDDRELLRRAESLVRARRFTDAVPLLVDAVRRFPNDPALHNDLGAALLLTSRFAESIPYLTRAASLRPAFPGTHYSLGLALQETGDDAGAIAAYGRAVALAPGIADAHARMGDLFMRFGRHYQAVAAYERAAAAVPGSPIASLCKAKALRAADHEGDVEPLLRDAILREPNSAEAHLLLGNVLSDAGRFDEAVAAFERSLAISPAQAGVYHALVNTRRVTVAERPWLERILARLHAKGLGARPTMTLHFAAGKAFDDLGDYANAMVHFDAANALRKRLTPFDRGRFQARVERILARFTRAFIDGQASIANASERPLLVLGMPRSGTTLVERMLSAHPLVAGGGELAFWNEHASSLVDADDVGFRAKAVRAENGYLDLLRALGGDAPRVTDKMPGNFLWLGVVHSLFPNARFVHCRRDPLDTCLSLYFTHVSEGWGFASDRADLVWYYRQYERLMRHWRAVVPATRLLDVDYEAVVDAPEAAARSLVGFAGLEWDPACVRPEQNQATVRTANKWQARQPVTRSRVERWKRYEPWLGELSELRVT